MALSYRVLLDGADVSESVDTHDHAIEITRDDSGSSLELFMSAPASPGQRIQVDGSSNQIDWSYRFDGHVSTVSAAGLITASHLAPQ